MPTQLRDHKMFLAGKWVNSEMTLEVFDPQDNTLVGFVPAATAEDMLFTIEQAKIGAQIAQDMSVHQRMDILTKAANYISDNHEKYALTIAREGSKTIREAKKEVSRCVQTLRLSAEEARRINGETIPFDQMSGSENRVGYYYRFPLGIVGAITPFNDPLNLVAHKVGPAIASGNAIIVKPSSITPLSALLLANAFEYAGLPHKVLSVITGSGRQVGDVLVNHPDVRMVSFTGGLKTGEEIAHKAGLKKISMELGSNSPVIILNDADLDKAADATVSGAFSAAGQNCIGVQRIYVQDDVFNIFTEKFIERTSHLITGDKLSDLTDMGPLINEREAIRVEEWVDEAVSKGAKLLIGGKRNGAFYKPTVLMNVPSTAIISHQEIFGPVVLLYSMRDLNEAIDRANNVNYGLQAGIFTQDIEKAFKAIHHMKVGGIMINDSSDYRIDGMPFGGIKGSGVGREGVKYAIQEMTEPKVVCFNLAERTRHL